jgi:peptidyl-prolyl cis-trans isomerase C
MTLFLLACTNPQRQAVEPTTLAVVGEIEIDAERLQRAFRALYRNPSEQTPKNQRKTLNRLIDIEILLLEARKRNLHNDIRVKNKVLQKEQELMLEELFRRGVVAGNENVTTEEAREYFDRYHIAEERRVSRILIASPIGIDRVFQRTHAGEDFAEIAMDLSEDGETAMQGGDIGWMSRLSFKSHILRRQVFNTPVGELLGPIQEPDGYSIMKIVDTRNVPFESAITSVKEVMVKQKQALATFEFLEGLADRVQIREHAEGIQLLLTRLSQAGKDIPEFKRGELQQPLFTVEGANWTIEHFMNAMHSERDQAEIRTVDDLRSYAKRLYAFKIELPKYGREQGMLEIDTIADALQRVEREELLGRLRDQEVIEQIDFDESDEQKYFKQNKDRYTRPERTSILEVLVDEREQALKLRTEIEKGGDFDELARRYSIRSTRIRRAGGRMQLLNPDKYGKLGWEAKDAEVGEIVGPIKTNNGYSVFKVLKKIPEQEVEFEQTIGRVRAHLRQDLSEDYFDEFVSKLRRQYKDQIVIYDENLEAYQM